MTNLQYLHLFIFKSCFSFIDLNLKLFQENNEKVMKAKKYLHGDVVLFSFFCRYKMHPWFDCNTYVPGTLIRIYYLVATSTWPGCIVAAIYLSQGETIACVCHLLFMGKLDFFHCCFTNYKENR